MCIEAMPKRAALEPPPSETHRVRPESFSNYRSQVLELLSQDEGISHHHDQQQTIEKQSNTPIGDGMSNLKKEELNVLLRQCVTNLTPEVDEMQQRVSSIYLISQLGTNGASSSPDILRSIVPEESGGATEEDIQLLVESDPALVKTITSQYSSVLRSKLEDMQQQVEKLLDDVVTTCRPMTRGEKRDLQKLIKDLPERHLDRIAKIIGNHHITYGKDFSDEVTVNLDQLDDIVLWRLHFYVKAVRNARNLAS